MYPHEPLLTGLSMVLCWPCSRISIWHNDGCDQVGFGAVVGWAGGVHQNSNGKWVAILASSATHFAKRHTSKIYFHPPSFTSHPFDAVASLAPWQTHVLTAVNKLLLLGYVGVTFVASWSSF